MAYATPAEFFEYMPQAEGADGADALAASVLARASAVIDGELGYSFAPAAATAVAYGDGTDFLAPPVFVAGSVTAVTAPAGWDVPDYVERDGLLVVVRSNVAGSWYLRSGLTPGVLAWPYEGGWRPGVPYTVAATFGTDAAPDDIVEATLELAVRMWRGRDAGFSDVVGVEGGGAVGYNGALPALVKRILDNYRRSAPGVY